MKNHKRKKSIIIPEYIPYQNSIDKWIKNPEYDKLESEFMPCSSIGRAPDSESGS